MHVKIWYPCTFDTCHATVSNSMSLDAFEVKYIPLMSLINSEFNYLPQQDGLSDFEWVFDKKYAPKGKQENFHLNLATTPTKQFIYGAGTKSLNVTRSSNRAGLHFCTQWVRSQRSKAFPRKWMLPYFWAQLTWVTALISNFRSEPSKNINECRLNDHLTR